MKTMGSEFGIGEYYKDESLKESMKRNILNGFFNLACCIPFFCEAMGIVNLIFAHPDNDNRSGS